MIKHYILNLNPQAHSDWDRCLLRNPITGERPDLTAEIAKAVSNQAGSYLIKVNVEVEVLEKTVNPVNTTNTIELATGKSSTALDLLHKSA